MELFDHITPESTIITSNRSISATLLKKHQQYQIMKKNTCWKTLDVLPLMSWVQRQWAAYIKEQWGEAPLVLTDIQSQIIWEDILLKNSALLQPTATASMAKSAWSLLKQWRLPIDHPMLTLTAEGTLFQEWAKQFQTTCYEHQWLDIGELVDALSNKIKTHCVPLPKQLVVIRSVDWAPQYIHLFECCEQMGTTVLYKDMDTIHDSSQAYYLPLPDEETEMLAMARWAKAIMEKKSGAPPSIGCIVPGLEKRERIQSVFAAVLDERQSTIPLSYALSIKTRLSSSRMIQTALTLLQLDEKNIPVETIRSLLRSPFIGEAEKEQSARAKWDSHLRHANIKKLFLPFNEIHGAKKIADHCPFFAKRFIDLYQSMQTTPAILPVDAWAPIFMERLNLVGWPGERSLNEKEDREMQCWLAALNAYQTLAHILPELSYSEALPYFIQCIDATFIQPPENNAAIQIVDVEEALTRSFDYLWIMGLNDTSWPVTAMPHPFIPLSLQKKAGMPHAFASQAWLDCQKKTTQFSHAAKEIIFSYPLQNADGECRPSTLITCFKPLLYEDLALSAFTAPAIRVYRHRQLETFYDEEAPPVQTHETIRGGASIFKQQAACPFKAFAEIRLNAYPLKIPTLGLRPEERGTLTHKTLELVWKRIKNSDNLHALNEIALTQLLSDSILEAMQLFSYKRSASYSLLETKRLHALIWKWLELEKKRPHFSVFSQEEERNLVIGRMTVTLRIDRIDELLEGEHLIIDYKTGKNNTIAAWFGERPDEPQLPLYCLTDPNHTIGMAFAEMHPANLSLKGISKESLSIDSIQPFDETRFAENKTWAHQLQQWQQFLEKIGNAFYEGNASVDPKDGMQTCQYCELTSFCRIHENQPSSHDEPLSVTI